MFFIYTILSSSYGTAIMIYLQTFLLTLVLSNLNLRILWAFLRFSRRSFRVILILLPILDSLMHFSRI